MMGGKGGGRKGGEGPPGGSGGDVGAGGGGRKMFSLTHVMYPERVPATMLLGLQPTPLSRQGPPGPYSNEVQTWGAYDCVPSEMAQSDAHED